MPGTLMESIRRRFEERRDWWSELSPSRRLLLLGLVSVVLLFIRRPMQFIHPDVWVEDGTILVPDVMRFGVRSIGLPVNGYLLMVPRVICYLAMQAPLELYPAVSTLLAVAFDVFVVLCIAWAPTILRNRSLCALAVLLIPTDSEVYALPSYTFWFAALLPIIAVLWRPDDRSRSGTIGRVSAIVFGGLSSPIAVIVLPLFVLRAALLRTVRELWLAGVAVLAAGLQLWFILPRNAKPASSIAGSVDILIAKFFGSYLFSPAERWLTFTVGCMLIVFVGVGVVVRLRSFLKSAETDGAIRRMFGVEMLLYVLLPLVIGASVVRAPLTLINPLDGGPRYFFLPYICLSWILLNMPGRLLGAIAAVALLLAVMNGASNYVRLQDPSDWAGAVREYRRTGHAVFPVQFVGMGGLWEVELPPKPVESE